MWDLNVLVPDRCLSFYFAKVANPRIVQAKMDITYYFIEIRLCSIMVIHYL